MSTLSPATDSLGKILPRYSELPYASSGERIEVYTSLGGAKVKFAPLNPNIVKFYVCGLTPYDHPHLGHALSAVRCDIVRRYLIYRGLEVQYIQNVTDIDDKIINRAKETGEDALELTRRYTSEYYAGIEALNNIPPTQITKVTEHIPQIITFIQKLISLGFAYASTEGNVYFDVQKRADYGKLSNQKLGDLYENVRKEGEQDKRYGLDFALWKRDDSPILTYESPWGRGRPGWHIECSVMINESLGEEIDIHGGGLDLKFPHHENEIAQSESYTGKPLARVWMHSGLLAVEGQKMSKSLGNFITIDAGLKKFGPELMRFVILRQHYRSNIDFSEKLFSDQLNSLKHFIDLFERAKKLAGPSSESEATTGLCQAFESAMNADFNTPLAMVALDKARETAEKLLSSNVAQGLGLAKAILEFGQVLGLFRHDFSKTMQELLNFNGAIKNAPPTTVDKIQALLIKRTRARATKDFNAADTVRQELASSGIEVLDRKDGPAEWRFA